MQALYYFFHFPGDGREEKNPTYINNSNRRKQIYRVGRVYKFIKIRENCQGIIQ